jgi:hypothetical protein
MTPADILRSMIQQAQTMPPEKRAYEVRLLEVLPDGQHIYRTRKAALPAGEFSKAYIFRSSLDDELILWSMDERLTRRVPPGSPRWSLSISGGTRHEVHRRGLRSTAHEE